MIVLLFALQAAALPDLSLTATVNARSLTVERSGEARLDVSASPDAGSAVKVVAPPASGRKTVRNVRITVDAEARIANGLESAATPDAPPR
jgi:hypothetical protein